MNDTRQLSRLVAAPTSFVGPNAPSLGETMGHMRGKKLDEIFKAYDAEFKTWKDKLYLGVTRALASMQSKSSADPRIRWQKWLLFQNQTTGSFNHELLASDGGSGLNVQFSQTQTEFEDGKVGTYALISVSNTIPQAYLRVTLVPSWTEAEPSYHTVSRRIVLTPVGATTVDFLYWLETIPEADAESERLTIESAYVELV